MKNYFAKETSRKEFRVTIFGSARMKKSDICYKQVYSLAKLIGKEDMDIVTGGGPGLMEAANKGYKDSKGKGHSIGLVIKLPWENKPNKSVDYYKVYNRFSKRLDTFMALSNVFVVASGGIGTLLELFYSWQLIQVKHTCKVPIILMGDMWQGLLKWIKRYPLKNNMISKEDLDIIYYANNAKEAFEIIKSVYDEFKKGGKNFCLNYKKYKA
ncbi:LOG family protein [Candidatus Woesearchaeota archaeon]|nr:MAG: LOG family protein [Candidatus Woesearchaeota archaeon]